MKQLALVVAVLLLTGCQTDKGDTSGESEAARKQCQAQGGQYGPGGLAGFACFKATPDAGKSCSGQGDCSGLCLADTRTCSVETPLFGCHPVQIKPGEEAMICID